MTINALVTGSAVLAGISVILQTTSFIIPGWLIVDGTDFSLNMAMWYAVFCEHVQIIVETNRTEVKTQCEQLSYTRLFNERNSASLLPLRPEFEGHVGTQVQVTSCWVLAVAALVLVILQKWTFQKQTSSEQMVYQETSSAMCNLRAKFLYFGGFSAIFQMFSGVLLSLVIIDFSKRYFALAEAQSVSAVIPHTLFIAGTAVFFSGLCSISELYIVFRARDVRNCRNRHHGDGMHKIPMALFRGQRRGQLESETRQSSIDQGECMGDYFGLEYSAEDPALMYRTQGTKKADKPVHPFPGYRLAKQNLKGHDKEWWSKVTYASMPYI